MDLSAARLAAEVSLRQDWPCWQSFDCGVEHAASSRLAISAVRRWYVNMRWVERATQTERNTDQKRSSKDGSQRDNRHIRGAGGKSNGYSLGLEPRQAGANGKRGQFFTARESPTSPSRSLR